MKETKEIKSVSTKLRIEKRKVTTKEGKKFDSYKVVGENLRLFDCVFLKDVDKSIFKDKGFTAYFEKVDFNEHGFLYPKYFVSGYVKDSYEKVY